MVHWKFSWGGNCVIVARRKEQNKNEPKKLMEEKQLQKLVWGCLKMHEKDQFDDFDVKGGYSRD